MQEKLPVDKTHMSVYLNSCLLGCSVSLLKSKRKKRKKRYQTFYNIRCFIESRPDSGTVLKEFAV